MAPVLWICLVILAAGPSTPEAAAAEFWRALSDRDRSAAVERVEEESRPIFDRMPLLTVKDWHVVEARQADSDRAFLRVRARFLSPLGFEVPVQLVQEWVLRQGSWRLRISSPSPERLNEGLFGLDAERRDRVAEGLLRLKPREVLLHFLNRVQRGSLFLENHTDQMLRFEKWSASHPELVLLMKPSSVAPGETARFILEYQGAARPVPERAEVELVFADDDNRKHQLRRAVVFNYIAPQAVAFYGLSNTTSWASEEIEALSPVLPNPQRR